MLLGPALHLAPNAKASEDGDGNNDLTLSASGIELRISKRTGAWTELIDTKSGVTVLKSLRDYPMLSLTTDGKESSFPPMLRPPGDEGLSGEFSLGLRFKYSSHTVIDEGEATLLEVNCRQEHWSASVEYRIPHHERRVERRFRIRYDGSREVYLRQIDVELPNTLMQEGDLIEIPAASLPPSVLPSLVAGRTLGPGDPGMFALRNPDTKQTVLLWAYSETEMPRPKITAAAGLLKLRYFVRLAAKMKAGDEIAWAGDYLWLMDGEWFEALERFQQRWAAINVRTPEDRPSWVERPVLYETQIGAAVFDRGQHQFNPYPTTQSLIEKLDYIRSLGFNTLQLMPRHPCPSYAVYDYFDPVHQYCGGQGLATLIRELRKRNMRIILDWIVHGVIDKQIARKLSAQIHSVHNERYLHTNLPDYVLNFAPAWIEFAPEVNPLRARHPDWFMKFQDGSLGHIYTWAFDLENEELQNYIIEAMKFYIREYDVDGFRVDAPTWNAFPNWDPKLRYRASLSITGGIRLFDRARPLLRQLKPDLMLYTEPTGPVFRRMFDVNYSYDELWMMEQLLAWRRKKPQGLGANYYIFAPEPPPGGAVTAFQFRAWLEDRRRSLPIGSETIHQVDSHDSFWWLPWGYRFRRQQFGVEGYRALFFMLSTLDGGLMQYPTAEEGSEEFVRRTLALRQTVPELNQRRCDYLKAKVSDDRVFAVSWESPSGWAVPLTNLGPAALNLSVSLPREQFTWQSEARYVVRDVFSNHPVNGQSEAVVRGAGLETLRVSLKSLESALLVVRKLPP